MSKLRNHLAAIVPAMRFSLYWLMFTIFFSETLPQLLKVWTMITSIGLFALLREPDGWKALVLFTCLLLFGTTTWLMSKVEERKFVEIITKR